ncbi:MAG: roadblock/LC7 domain-containing protein [Chloroflexi bacterium]|nr:roadblock/LC7 domain-containing protein [Chloroflexota bacterium]
MFRSVEAITQELEAFGNIVSDIEASAVVSRDGLIIATNFPPDLDESSISAMSATMVSLGAKIASALARGAVDQLYIRGEKGYAILVPAGEHAVFTVLAKSSARLGLIMRDIRKTSFEVAKLVQ